MRGAHRRQVAELTADQRVQADFANYRGAGVARSVRRRPSQGRVAANCWVLTIRARAQHGDLESGPLKSVADKLDSALTGAGPGGW